MNRYTDLFFEFLRSRLLGPKDYFERQKKRLLWRTFSVIFVVFAGPAAILTLLSNVDKLEVTYKEMFIQFIGRASNDSLVLAIVLLVVFIFSLLSNLIYGIFVKVSTKDLAELENKLKP